MSLGIAEVHEEPIPKQLSNMSFIALNDFRADFLVSTHYVPVLFGIELTGKFGGINQVAEHHRELPSFSFWRMRSGTGDFARSGVLCQAAFLLSRWLCRGWFRCRFARPHEHLTVLIHSKLLDPDDLNFQVF